MLLFILLSSVFLALYYLKFYLKWRKGPPGPLPLPMIGNVVQILQGPKNPTLAIARFSKLYGDIFRLQIGIKEYVVMSSVDSIAELCNKDEALARDCSTTFFHDRSQGQNTGIVTSSGKTWETTRKWTFKTLNKLGMRKGTGIETGINEQCDAILTTWSDLISSSPTKGWVAIEVATLMFMVPITKVVFRLVMGDRIFHPVHGPKLEKMIRLSQEAAKNVSFTGIDVACPMLGYVFPSLTARWQHLECHTEIRKAAIEFLDHVRHQRAAGKPKQPSIVDEYLQIMDDDPTNPNFSDFHFASIYMDLLQASSETQTSFQQALILFSILYPQCQERVFEELTKTIPAGEPVTLEYQKRMPYTEAFMLETQRTIKVVLHLVPRRVTADFTHGKYFIPKDTILIADTHSANNDTRIWSNPGEFDPSRWLDSEGRICSEKRKNSIPFGSGRRMCPGSSVAEWVAFLFFMNILRTFKLSRVPGEEPPTAEMKVGAYSGPYPFNVAISKRE